MKLGKTDSGILKVVDECGVYAFKQDFSCNNRKMNSAHKLNNASIIELTRSNGWYICHPKGTRIDINTLEILK